MKFNLNEAIEVLSRTPSVLESILNGLSDDWLQSNEGENTWSPFEVVGHLIHGEKTDWIIRSKIILSNAENKTFEPFDRFAQINNKNESSINELLLEFRRLREENIKSLKELNIKDEDFLKTGVHPDLGIANLQQLLATWVVHDLGHIAQITRVMAKQYKSEVGPWGAYLRVLNE